MTRAPVRPDVTAVHPAAAVWPLLPADELQALADDIAANGLIHPIVLTPAGEVLDGRNRAAACDLAKVDPEYVTHSGDPVAYVLSANANRRHMSKGAQAMAGWAAAQTVSQNMTVREFADAAALSRGPAGQAAMVAKWAPEQVPDVIAGTTPLDKAHTAAKQRKDEHDTRDARLERLPDDLADLVTGDRMSLTEAEAALQRRTKDIADQRTGARALLTKVTGLLDPRDTDPAEWAADWVGRLDVTRDDVDSVARMLKLLTAMRAAMRGAVSR